MIKQLAIVGMMASVSAAGASLARADSVSLDTFGGSNWTVQRVLVGGESNTAAGTFAVQNVANNPGWSSLGDPNAKWVAWNSSTGSGYTGDVNGTTYIYQDAFTLGGVGQNALTLTGSFLTDNYATDVTLTANGNTVPVTLTKADPSSVVPLGPTEFGYHYAVDVAALGNFTGPANFVLTVTTVNSYADAGHLQAGTNPGPTGFELSGVASVTAVPLPDASWMGMSLLGGLGGLGMLRKRLMGV